MAEVRYTGGAWLDGCLYSWGADLLAGGRKLESGPFTFGCIFRGAPVLERRGVLRWHDSVIDTNAQVIDACEAELFGRNGLLVVQRGMQLRFYEPPLQQAKRWPYREIYSFYTASEQGGLLLHDVNGDGRPDILCGNYWVQSPSEFDSPWRLYAINLFHDHPLAASARLAWVGGRLLWLESKRPKARMSWFTPPSDPTQLWIEEPVGVALDYPRTVLVRDGRVWIGHGDGVIELPGNRVVRRGIAVTALVESPDGVFAIGPNEIVRL